MCAAWTTTTRTWRVDLFCRMEKLARRFQTFSDLVTMPEPKIGKDTGLQSVDVTMPEAEVQTPRVSGVKGWSVPSRNQLAPTSRQMADDDAAYVRGQLFRIAALVDAGKLTTARGSCADLLFDFQPFIAAQPDLLDWIVTLLGRCDAVELRQRLLIAAGVTAGPHEPNRQASKRTDARLETLAD